MWRVILDLYRNNRVRTIHQAKGCFLCSGLGSGVVSPHNSTKCFCLGPLGLLQPSLQTSEQNSVGRLDLPIRPWVFVRTLALSQDLYTTWPTTDLQTGCHCRTPTILELQSGILCSSTQSVGPYGLWFVLLAQPLSTLWNTLWQPRGTSSAVSLKGMAPEYWSPKYETTKGYRST